MACDVTEDDRTTELSSIAAIFPELIIDPSNPYHATLELPVTPLKPLRIRFEHPVADGALILLPTPPTSVDSGDGAASVLQNRGVEEIHEVEHLPSLKVDMNLHEKYPIDDPPRVHIIVDHQWLPRKKLQELEADCRRLWEDFGRDQVIFSYLDHIQQQAEDCFGIANDSMPLPLSADLKLALLDFDLQAKRQKFERETFDCGVCLEPKKGRDCHRLLLCGHVFCTACIAEFYTNCISEGDVDNVKCMDPSCGKDTAPDRPLKRRRTDRTLNPSELLQIPLSQELVQRYVRLKRKQKLESDKNTIYCPRRWCQGPAFPEHRKQKSLDDFGDFSESEAEDEAQVRTVPSSHSDLINIPMSQRLAICSDCGFAFCLVCRKTWHGAHSTAAAHCNPRDPKEMAAEEKASAAYLERFSTPCPTCDAPAQKTMGCNHMVCFRCKTHFCYLCASFLMPDNPYEHFNNAKNTCYMRLWELAGGDGENGANNGAGVGIEGMAWDEEPTDDEGDEVVPAAAPIPPQPVALAPILIPVIEDPDDTSDEEPAPDVRRHERAIEFVNFANPARGRRINIPDRQRPEAHNIPPMAPDPPRNNRRGRGQQANWRRRQLNEPPHNHNHMPPRPHPRPNPAQQPLGEPLADRQEEAVRGALLDEQLERLLHNQDQHEAVPVQAAGINNDFPPPAPLPRAAPGQNNHDAVHPAPARMMGLERFLELARLDAEDEWDSDELDEDEGWDWGFDQARRGGVGIGARR